MDKLSKCELNTECNEVWIDVMNRVNTERKELLKALRNLNSVKSDAWTKEQQELKFLVGCQVEEILRKYEGEE